MTPLGRKGGAWRTGAKLAAFASLIALVVATIGSGRLSGDEGLARFELGEDRPGGEATSKGTADTTNAFSLSSGNMPFTDELRFKVGNGLFKKVWISSPASTKASDGLGPLFNAKSCQLCHIKDGRGHPPRSNWPDSDALSMVLRLSIPGDARTGEHARDNLTADARPEPVYGTQLQDLAIQGHRAEGKIHVTYSELEIILADGERVSLRRPTYSITHLGYGPLHPETQVSPRIAPPMIGLGLLEAVPGEAILKHADPDDADGDGISGRPNWVHEDGIARLGRFGWKAGNATLAQQTAEAFANDIGVSSPLLDKPSGDCTAAQSFCLDAPNGNTPAYGGAEINQDMFDLVVFYSQNLAVPARRDPRSPALLRGKALFTEIGCAACHVPSFTTGANPPGGRHLGHQTIWPYTDLLLHDMGDGLADNRPEREANGREWRTPPLWGIGLTERVNGHTFLLHDGRARNVLEAILWHGGEAERARHRFTELTKADRDALIAFVNSL